VAFYVIAQGPGYKNDICHINFGNTVLSSPYVLSVGIINFWHICNNREMKKKRLV
jgi:subtilase family serine protease